MPEFAVFAGTTEGRTVIVRLLQQHARVDAFVATEYGQALLPAVEGLTVHRGAMPGEEIEERIVESVDLRKAVSLLEERQRSVIGLRYYRGLTQEKTAEILGISQVQVSRIERKALGILRQALASE